MLQLERQIAKEVPIRAALRGAPAPGFDIYATSISPPSVIVSGPRSSVEGIEEMYTETIPIADLRQSLRVFANLNIRDDSVHCTPPGPAEVNVQVGPHRRQLRINGLVVVPDIENVRITPRDVSIQVLVPVTYPKPLTAADFSATVANSKMEEATMVAKLPVEVQLKGQPDPAIVIKSVQPAEVTVRRTK
jgi:YbbR domain-containing protein